MYVGGGRTCLYAHLINERQNPEKDRDVCGRTSDVSLRPFDQRATESIRGNGIDAYPVERAFTHFSA